MLQTLSLWPIAYDHAPQARFIFLAKDKALIKRSRRLTEIRRATARATNPPCSSGSAGQRSNSRSKLAKSTTFGRKNTRWSARPAFIAECLAGVELTNNTDGRDKSQRPHNPLDHTDLLTSLRAVPIEIALQNLAATAG